MPSAKATPTNRRSGTDRRRADRGAPQGPERRVGLEPRKPEVTEVEISESDWARLQDEAARRSARK